MQEVHIYGLAKHSQEFHVVGRSPLRCSLCASAWSGFCSLPCGLACSRLRTRTSAVIGTPSAPCRNGTKPTLEATHRSYYHGRLHDKAASPKCCYAEDCIQHDRNRYAVVTTLRNDAYLPLVEVHGCQLHSTSPHTRPTRQILHTGACMLPKAYQPRHTPLALYRAWGP